jgi:hypothetical protein
MKPRQYIVIGSVVIVLLLLFETSVSALDIYLDQFDCVEVSSLPLPPPNPNESLKDYTKRLTDSLTLSGTIIGFIGVVQGKSKLAAIASGIAVVTQLAKMVFENGGDSNNAHAVTPGVQVKHCKVPPSSLPKSLRSSQLYVLRSPGVPDPVLPDLPETSKKIPILEGDQLVTQLHQVFRTDQLTPFPSGRMALSDILALQAKVTQIRFFESGEGIPPRNTRVYATRFDASTARYINIELDLEYPDPGRVVAVPVSCVYFNHDGTRQGDITWTIQVQPWTRSWSTENGWGWKNPGNWPSGTHRVECSAEGRVIAQGSFEINQQPQQLPGNWNSNRFFPPGSSLDKYTIPSLRK